jgi:two-component system, chemotaxis family, chemotaxis protein CheY
VKKALVVDDSPYNRSVLSAMLRRLEMSVELAEDGESGVEKFKSFRPDVVFLDNIMPKMSGVEAVREIRKIDQKVIVVMVTSISASDQVAEAKTAGANAYILKPYVAEKIREVLHRFSLG